MNKSVCDAPTVESRGAQRVPASDGARAVVLRVLGRLLAAGWHVYALLFARL